jgi:hypothetical protein
MVLQADEGLDITEGSGISLDNIRLITKNTNPVMNIHNSSKITLNKIGYDKNAELLLNVTGEKTKNLVISQTEAAGSGHGAKFGYGATESVLEVK